MEASRSKRYIYFLVFLMGLVALMDQYLSLIRTTVIPYALNEFNISAVEFSTWESIYLIPTFFIFLLNWLADYLGRKKGILVLILMMGLPSIGIVFFASTFHLFMIFYAMIIYATISNMWTIPITEEAPPETRGRLLAITYFIGLIPLYGIAGMFIPQIWGWRWLYGIVFIMMLITLFLWFFMDETTRWKNIEHRDPMGGKMLSLNLLTRRDFFYIVYASIIWGVWLLDYIFGGWAAYYLINIRGYTDTDWSMIYTIGGLSAIFATIVSGWAMDKLGRRRAIILSSILIFTLLMIFGLGPVGLQPIVYIIVWFFLSFMYTWIIIYIPEVFPTHIRGACLGWVSTIARFAYVGGPLLAAFLLSLFPEMSGFWVVLGILNLAVPILTLLLKPYETKGKSLEEIELER